MKYYKVFRYLRATGVFYDTVVVKSALGTEAITTQMEKKDSDYFYRLEKINVPTIDIYGVHA